MQHQTVAEINLGALRANYRTLAAMAAPARVMPVVKANAYGHGVEAVAGCLAAEGAGIFAVVTLTEALELRQFGLAQEILVMGVVDPAFVRDAIGQNITVTLHGHDHARQCAAAAQATGRPLRCHLKVDTGMSRWGVAAVEAADLLAEAQASTHLEITGLMTHLACADEPDLGPNDRQLAKMQALLAEFQRRGLRPPLVHVAASSGVLRCPQARFDAVRPGLAVYGISPNLGLAAGEKLQPVMAVYSVVALIKEIGAGQGVSYNHSWRAPSPSRLAILPIGYADGYRRALSNRAQVRVEGRLAPVVGNVCMDAIVIDVTNIPAARVGSRAALMEADAASPLSAYALAKLAGTISYEILTGIGPRVRRIYIYS
jgi:alanine racemase